MMRNAFSQDRASHNGDLVAFPSAMERPQGAVQLSSPAPSAAPSGVSAIVVIDRRALIRECLARCLAAAAGCRVTAFASVDAWMSAEVEGEPSLVLFSTASLQHDMETQRQMALVVEACPAMPMVVMSDGDDADHIVEALDKGMRGYIPTGVTLDVAVGAIGLVGAGGTYVPATSLMAARRSESAPGQPRQVETGLFTARQASVVEGIRRGKPNKIIAYELNMCESTVKVHVRAIMKKLNATNRTEVAFKTSALLGSLEQRASA